MDVWGPYRILSISGCYYFLTLVNDHSKCTWIYLLKYKLDAPAYFKIFHSMVMTQFQTKILGVRTDNAPELSDGVMLDFFQQNGINLKTSCTRTPQQNGIAERKDRNLLEVARALRFQVSLPIKFWGECMLAAAYLINPTYSQTLKMKSPYEVLYNKLPSLSHLKVFGCLCYVHKGTSYKFETRSKSCIFLSYPMGQKGYNVYD